MMKKTLVTTSLILFSPFCFALDLVEAYELAKRNDPNWQANLYQYESEQQNLGVAKANLLPTVTVGGSVTRRHQELDDSNTWNRVLNTLDLMPTTTTTKQAAISVRQPLFRLEAWQGYKQVKTSLELSEVTLKLQRQKHLLNVSEAYFNVLRQQALTATNLQEEKALYEQLRAMNARQKEGLVSRSDVGEANAQYHNARANRIATGVQLVLAQEQLAQLIGTYQDKLAVLRDDFQYQKPVPASLNEWANLAETHNLEVLQGKLQLKVAEDQRRIEQAARYPTIDAVGSYGYTAQSPNSLISNDGQFNQIGVEMNWNVFTSGRTKANIQKAKLNVKKTDSQLSAIIRKATTDVKKSYMQVETDQSTLQARKTAMDSSALVSRASQAQYNEGLKSMVDVLLAQRNAFSAKQQYVNTQYDYILNVLRLKAAIGQLNEQELAQMNAWLTYK
ncbi:TolC family outer membrane protein [Acinetobacter sp. 194]|uniref:multidrug efflux outer membrane protein AbuO n=1 Tax=Acinetobacter shaoyimingii TaxID=2715164 RepID=UPI00140AB112|nr:TolC family outer membrane protein [Acinetobacter shaoyimingii]NHB59176.1 TolC family outer membrane protein [Acinetobacter shaoyimingii]